MLPKQETSLGRGARGADSQRVTGPRRMLRRGLTLSGFMVMGSLSGWSLAGHSDSGAFRVAPASLSQGGCRRGGFWELTGCVASPFDLSQILPGAGGLRVLCSLPGPPVVK